MAHVHKDLIIAWANGAKIEYYSESDEEWFESDRPSWNPETKYRIKQPAARWIKVDGVRPEDMDNPFVQWYSADGRTSECFLQRLNFGMSQEDPHRVMFIRILKDE